MYIIHSLLNIYSTYIKTYSNFDISIFLYVLSNVLYPLKRPSNQKFNVAALFVVISIC